MDIGGNRDMYTDTPTWVEILYSVVKICHSVERLIINTVKTGALIVKVL